VTEDTDLVISRVTASFWEPQFPLCTEEPCSSPSANETDEADITVFDDLDHSAIEKMTVTKGQELGEVGILSSASLEHVANEIDEFYNSLCEELNVQPLEDDWIMEGSVEIPGTQEAAAAPGATDGVDDVSTPVGRMTSFMAWSGTDSDREAVPVIGESQKLLKKVVAGGAWENNGGGNTTRSTQESGIRNHVMSERRRREKLSEMFLILKSLVPTIQKVVQKKLFVWVFEYTIEFLTVCCRWIKHQSSRRR
jgi:hypothetical protein